ncbi:MAG: mechanosensitive ion channel family protein [Clostridia bacterium]
MSFDALLKQLFGGLSFDKLGWALLATLLSLIAVHVIMRFATRVIDRLPLERTLTRFIASSIRLVLYFMALLLVAGVLGIPVTSLLALFSVAGLAVSLAIQDSLSNLFSGIMILISKPFTAGDFVEIGGVSGTADSISLVYTRLLTADNKLILVPNREISAGKIINYTRQPNRRVEVKISCDYLAPIDSAKQALFRAMADVTQLLGDPAPFVGVNAYGASGIEYVLRAWVPTADYWDAYYLLMERVKARLDEAHIEIPFNRIDVHLRGGA